MTVADNLATVKSRIRVACTKVGRAPDEVELLAVSKKQPAVRVREARAAGQQAFGENRVQELVAKSVELEGVEGIRWHMIGSLQTNKVRDLLRVHRLELLHSLDRSRLADELQRELQRQDRSLDALLQVNVTADAHKHGCGIADVEQLLAHVRENCPRLRVVGLMAMAPLRGASDAGFARVAGLWHQLIDCFGPLPRLSLGMSGDLEPAIAAGSTLVRIGSDVFGARG